MQNVFDTALRAWDVGGASNRKPQLKGGSLFSLFRKSGAKAASNEPQAPVLPKGVPSPYIVVQTETYDTDLVSMVGNAIASDVDIYVDGEVIPAHRVLLCMGSQLFCRVFGCAESARDNLTVKVRARACDRWVMLRVHSKSMKAHCARLSQRSRCASRPTVRRRL
jgi:hypothetical protein